MSAAPSRLYYRPAEVAAMLGVSLKTVQRRLRTGRYRSIRDGGCRLIYAEDVHQTANPTTPQPPGRATRALARELGL